MAKKIERLRYEKLWCGEWEIVEKLNEVIEQVNKIAFFCPLPDDKEENQ
jgi:hypothetical protein